MRCYSCNCVLNTQASTRRFKGSGDFVDLCNKCLATIDDEVEVTEGRVDEDDSEEWDD